MTTQINDRRPPALRLKEVIKDASMVKQKEMMAAHYDRLTNAPETGDKVAATFVPGNLNELLMCFDLVNNLPEVNAIQNGLRRTSGGFVLEAEKIGHSEDVCTYVKSDIGMMAKGNIAPNGKKFPNPDVLLLSYTGCFTFMKWFELLREQYKCETIMLHTPYMGDGKITKNMIDYMVKQLKEEVIPKLERVSGVKFDIDRLREYLKKSAKAEDDLVWVLQSAKTKPSPIDAYFGGIYYIGPIFGAFRGTDDAIDYYKFLREEVEARQAAGHGPVTPDGDMGKEKYRLVVEGPPNYTNFRQFWKMFYDEGAVVVASSYTKVGGVYDFGFRHDPDKPLETLAEYCLGVYTNRNLPMRIDMLGNYINEYEADGLLINSIKSCNSFSAGQLLIMREVEKRTGKPAAFVESDLVDPRYFSAANIKNRLESYFQMIEQKRAGVRARGLRRTRMKTFVGIDLGSTTTKAVLLDENRDVIGRGITNSRSNYAHGGARRQPGGARRRPLHAVPPGADRRRHGLTDLDEFLGALERAFRLEQFLEQLDDLEQTCLGQIQGERFAKVASGSEAKRSARCSSACARKRPSFTRRAPSASPTSSATSPARATTCTPRRSRARRTCPTICCSTSTTSRSSRSRTGRRRAISATSSAARSGACSNTDAIGQIGGSRRARR